MVALVAAVGTVPMRPAVLTRKRSERSVGSRVGAVAATTSIRTVVPISICAAVVVPVVVVVVVVGAAATGTIAHERHEVAHLGKESRFAGGKSGFAGQKCGIGCGGKLVSWNGRISVRWKRGKNAFGNKIGHDGCIGLIGVVEIPSSGEVLEIRLGSTKVDDHLWPGLVGGREFGPSTNVGLQGPFFGKNDIGKIFHLFGGDGSTTMGGEVDEIVDGVEDNIDRSGDRVRHVGDGGLLGFHLLRGDGAVGGEKMGEDRMEIGCVRSSGAVHEGSDVHGVDGIDDLRHKGFGRSMVEVEAFFGSPPNFFGGSNLGASGADSWKKRSWSRRSNPWG